MAALREILAEFGFKIDDQKLKSADTAVESAIENVRTLAGVVAGSALVLGLQNFVNNIRATGQELDRTAAQLRIGSAELQELRFSAEQAGVANEDLDQALRDLNDKLGDAGLFGGEAAEVFDTLGVKVKDADGNIRTALDVLPDLADAFKGNENSAEKMHLAMTLLSDSGSRLVPFLEQGAEGLEKMREEARRLGGGLTNDAVKASAELTTSLAKLEFATLGLKGELASTLFPALVFLVELFTEGAGAMRSLFSNSSILEAALVSLGVGGFVALTRLAGGFRALILLAGKLLLRVALPILVLEDLFTLLRGGESLIGKFIDKAFGAGTSAKIAKFAKDTKEGLERMWSDLRDDPEQFRENFSRALDSVRNDAHSVFGDIGLFIFNALINWIDLWTGGWDNAKAHLAEFWNGVRAIVLAAVEALVQDWQHFAAGVRAIVFSVREYIEQQFLGAASSVETAFANLWNSVLGRAQQIVGAVGGVLGKIPGLSGAFEDADASLEGLKRNVGASPELEDLDAIVRRNAPTDRRQGFDELVRQFDRTPVVQGRGSGNAQITQTVHVTVPPGTPAGIANATARETGGAVRNNTRAAIGALGFAQ